LNSFRHSGLALLAGFHPVDAVDLVTGASGGLREASRGRASSSAGPRGPGVQRSAQLFAELLPPESSSAAAIASSQLSLAMGVPSWLGRMPSASVSPGVRRYIDIIDPENAARPCPAILVGTMGSSSEAPTAISPWLRKLANCSGVCSHRRGTPLAVLPCRL